MADLAPVALNALRMRMTTILPAQIRECVEILNEDELWWRPNDEANSVGNLVLHLSGSIRHYICHQLGGLDYQRDRDAEFAERGPIGKTDLLKTWDETIEQVSRVLREFDTNRFLEPTVEPNYVPTNFDLIYNASIHLATHAGQIVWITKMLEQGSVDELWIKTHRKNPPRA